MAEVKKVPELRFKGFEGEWKEEKLSKIGETYSGLSGKTKADFGHGDGKYITYMNVFSNTIADPKMTEPIEIDKSQNAVKAGDVLFTTSSETPEEVGLSTIWVENAENIYLNSFCFGYRPQIKFDYNYLAYVLRSNTLRKKITFLAQGISRYNISKNKVMEIDLPIPHDEEQTKIGNYFQNLDNYISLHQRKYNMLLTVKKAMLEKMFPREGADVPEIRFKGFERKWEKRFLGDEVEFFSGLTYSPSSVVKSGGTFVLRSSNVKYGEVVEADNVYVDSYVVNCNNVIVGDIIVVVRNGSRSLIGKHAQIKKQMDNTVIGAFMTGIHSKKPAFINSLLDTNQFNKEIEKNLGATINQITTGAFKKMQFMFPDEDEQTKIGTFFQNLDMQISQHQKQLEKLKNVKKACLEKMFL